MTIGGRRLASAGRSALLAASFVALAMTQASVATPKPAQVSTAQHQSNGRLVFIRALPLGLDEWRNEIYSSLPDGTDLRRLTQRGDNGAPQWGPAGRRILFGRNGNIWVMGANGEDKRRVVGGRAFDMEAAWAPHGRRIVFVRDFTDLMVYSVHTGKVRRIIGKFAWPRYPAWSPNGRRILFSGATRPDFEVPDIYTIRPDGARLRNLTKTPGVWDSNPDWSPSGRKLVYVREGRGCRTLHIMRADGSRDRRVRSSCPADNPAWSPDGRVLAFNPRPEVDGSQVWSMSLDGSSKRFLIEGSAPDWQPVP